MDALLGHPKPIDAVFCASNLMSGYCLQYIHARRINVPDRIALAGFDSLDDFELFDAPYAYIRQPIQQMGSLAIQRLLAKLNGATKSAFLELQAELIVKQPARSPE